ncbi:replication factor C small subunit [Thermoplasma acidophilum]|uniref:Replication factor C small subunit n=1 Tax=Thermoplasma acidophilum (strain ATCC 25905 / DSM 1728 / JCM 9062 / NBRC 15155 / AMRC-C165) TaxID=273075 RepID=RFCS_THEAC|nr:replication factor C small subunit [Thermoplasma acidophilum]Q9HI47.2 RecName: Full=Replication factor C small subunit; Short=RFC small subunit; AltName: Full=Clamp loader small subunit [Thermoplasma acidophilum DSM 1728]
MIEIWTEKYRPKSLSEIYGEDENIQKLKSFVEKKEIPHLLFAGSVGTGKTSTAIALAIELFGDSWKENMVEMNASNENGIDVIRNKIKDIARIKPSNPLGFKILFLDEADQLTAEAQAALRRTMEIYSETTRFIFSCNYSSKIIPPIQSRTVVMRFRPVPDEYISRKLQEIAKNEGFQIDEESMHALVEVSAGDMRKAINVLQAVYTSGEISPKKIYEIIGYASPEKIQKMISRAINGLFDEAREIVDGMLIYDGLSGIDIVRSLHSYVRSSMISPKQKIEIIKALADAEFRIVEGSNDRIQLDALIAKLAEIGSRTD